MLPYTAGVGLGIEHGLMISTLRREVAARPGVTITTSCRVEDLVREYGRVVGVRTAAGEVHRAPLVVVADGRASRLRDVLGVGCEVRLLSYTVTTSVDGQLPSGPYGHVYLGAPGPVLAYPWAEGKSRFVLDVPVGAPKGRDAILQFLLSRYVRALPAALGDALRESLQRAPLELIATHGISTRACAAPGVVLLGDAGGCGHPLTASGLTNAMNDVLTLAEVTAAGPSDEALEAYQRRRYDYLRMRELFTDALYEVFCGEDAGSRALQRGVFQYWASSERSRAASMELLSGEDLDPAYFVSEYVRVLGLSAVDVLREGGVRNRAGKLGSLLATSLGRLEQVAQRTTRGVVERYRRELHRPAPRN